MGRHWAKYSIGKYRLGSLKGRATVNWVEGKTKHRFLLDAYDEKSGRAALSEFIVEHERQKDIPDITWGELYDIYLDDRIAEGKQERNIDNSWKALKSTFKDRKVATTSVKACRDYARGRFNDELAPATVWTELLMLRTMSNWAVKHKIFKEEYCPYIWLPSKGKGRKKEMSTEQIDRFLERVERPHVKLFFLIALSTGARSTAILELTWDRVDFENGIIDFLKPEAIDPMKKVVRKNRAEVAMGMVVRIALQEAWEARTCDHVIEWHSKPIKRIGQAFKTACDKAGIEGIHPHIIRHTCATFNLEQGVPLEVVSKLLGHSNLEITSQIYAHATPKLLAQATTQIDGLINKHTAIQLEGVNFVEYLIMKYRIDAADAEKLREIDKNSEHFTILEGEVNKKTEARKT